MINTGYTFNISCRFICSASKHEDAEICLSMVGKLAMSTSTFLKISEATTYIVLSSCISKKEN